MVSSLQRSFLALGCALGLALWGALAASAQTPAEQNFWDSIRSSRSPAEFRAYLDAFPKGYYADQARARIRELEGSASNLPPTRPSDPPPYVPPAPNYTTPPPPSSNASVLTNYTIIREVQERLYSLNYNIKVMNGQLSKETRDAIIQWQEVTRRPQTGDMNADDLQYLRSAPPVTTWGAIAFEAAGAYGIVWNRTSRQDAENDALAECRKHAAANAKNCDPFTLGDSQCGAMSWYSGYSGGRRHWGSFVVRRGTIEQARTDVMSECQRQAKAPQGCQIRVAFCANGSHKQ